MTSIILSTLLYLECLIKSRKFVYIYPMGVYNNYGDIMSNKIKERTIEEKASLIKRLNVIEGQVRGIKQMIEEDRYCDDVLIQISAIHSSLKSLGNVILKNHLSTCVVKEIKQDNLEVIDDIIDLFGRLNK